MNVVDVSKDNETTVWISICTIGLENNNFPRSLQKVLVCRNMAEEEVTDSFVFDILRIIKIFSNKCC